MLRIDPHRFSPGTVCGLYTGLVQTVWSSRGEGWGCFPKLQGREKIGTMREDVLSILPFSLLFTWPFVHLHSAGKAAYLGRKLPKAKA